MIKKGKNRTKIGPGSDFREKIKSNKIKKKRIKKKT